MSGLTRDFLLAGTALVAALLLIAEFGIGVLAVIVIAALALALVNARAYLGPPPGM